MEREREKAVRAKLVSVSMIASMFLLVVFVVLPSVNAASTIFYFTNNANQETSVGKCGTTFGLLSTATNTETHQTILGSGGVDSTTATLGLFFVVVWHGAGDKN